MGLCICRDWVFKERSSFTPVREADERANSNPKADRFFPFRPSLPSTSTTTNVCSTSQPTTSQPIERINSSNHNTNNTVDEERTSSSNSGGQEISYNKISVREPLSKVLAERAILEHHYNEVDGEGESCFYEEIAGATNTSVASTVDSKLGRQSSDEADVITDPGYEVVNFHHHQSKSEPCYAVIDKSLNNSGDDEVELAVMSIPGKSIDRIQSDDDEDYSTADPGYEVVNFHQQKAEPCYAVIDKNVNNYGDGEIGSTIVTLPGKSTVTRRPCDDDDEEDYSTADPGYEVVNFHPQKNEPCYAVIDKNINNSHDSQIGSAIISVPGKPLERRQSDYEDYLIADPGYEVINSQKSEPCYAVIDKNLNRSSDVNQVNRLTKSSIPPPVHLIKVTQQSTDDDDEDYSTADPGYEVISNNHQHKSEPCYAVIDKTLNSSSANQTLTTTRPLNSSIVSNVHMIKVSRQSTEEDDDSFADPGYEVISHQIKSEPCYAVIDKNHHHTSSSSSNLTSVPLKSSSSSIAPPSSVHNEKLTRQSTDDDDSFADPGYEVINRHQKKSDPS